jgi:hypothetical protein
LRLNRWQPERLHLRVQRKAFTQVLRQGFRSGRFARQSFVDFSEQDFQKTRNVVFFRRDLLPAPTFNSL